MSTNIITIMPINKLRIYILINPKASNHNDNISTSFQVGT